MLYSLIVNHHLLPLFLIALPFRFYKCSVDVQRIWYAGLKPTSRPFSWKFASTCNQNNKLLTKFILIKKKVDRFAPIPS